jgi:hypothetical protein
MILLLMYTNTHWVSAVMTFGYIPRSKNTGSYSNSIFFISLQCWSSNRGPHTCRAHTVPLSYILSLIFKISEEFCLHTVFHSISTGVPISPYQHLFSLVLVIAILWMWNSNSWFYSHFPNDCDVEYFFLVLIGSWYILFEEMSIQVLCPIYNWVF